MMDRSGNGARPAEPIDLVLVDFDDTLVETAPRFARARRELFRLLEGFGFDPAEIDRIHHEEVDPAMRQRHGFGPQRLNEAFRETYRTLCRAAGVDPEDEVAERCGCLGDDVAGIPPAIAGALEALRRLALQVPTAVYTQSGNPAYQVRCLRETGAMEAVGEDRIRVVPVKTAAALEETIRHFGVDDPARAWMVGNSIRSDINPALEVGVRAILVEIDDPWHHDVVDPIHDRFQRVPHFADAVRILLGSRPRRGPD